MSGLEIGAATAIGTAAGGNAGNEQKRWDEDHARRTRYLSILGIAGDETYDPSTRAEFAKAAQSGDYSLADSVNDVKLGKGKFGVRQKDYELAKIMLEKPGQQQVILSLQQPGQSGVTNVLGAK